MKLKYVIPFAVGLVAILALSMSAKMLSSTSVNGQSTHLVVAAAASLQDALEELEPTFETAHSGVTVHHTFAASGPLQQQIEQGAPVDVFISAAAKQMDSLQKKDLILPETRDNLLTNELVLIVPNTSDRPLTRFQELAESQVQKIAVGEPRSVPVGQYTDQVFTHLNITEQVRSKLVYGNSVRNVLSAVESGNVDAGIAYATDAKLSDRVKPVATAPDHFHTPIVYPIAVIKTSQHLQIARDYTRFLQSPPAQAVFQKYGFGIAP